MTPREAYQDQKWNARRRGLAFMLTFDEWWELWREHFDARGVCAGQMQMCRTRDTGGYTVGNVRVDTMEANQAERIVGNNERAQRRDWGEGSAGPGWLMDRGMIALGVLDDDSPEEEFDDDG